MKLINLLVLSCKNLLAHRMRTILTISGVAIGVGAIIFLVSIGFGLERLVTNQITNLDAFNIVDIPSSISKTNKMNNESIDKIQNLGHITQINKIINLAGRVRLTGKDSTTETVIVSTEPDFFNLSGISLENGNLYKKDDDNSIIINKALAGLLGYSNNSKDLIGQDILADIIIAKDLRNDGIDGPIIREKISFKVSGITDTGQNPNMFIALKQGEKLGIANYSSLKIKIDNQKNVAQIRKSIENLGFNTNYVGDTIEQIKQIFSLFRLILGGLGMIAMIVAGLATFNTLTISLFERIREVGLLKTLGMRRFDIFKLFIIESIIIGVLGGILGIFLGGATGHFLNTLLHNLAVKTNSQPVIVFYFSNKFAVYVGAGSFIVGILTGIYPAIKAIKTSALDALRYE